MSESERGRGRGGGEIRGSERRRGRGNEREVRREGDSEKGVFAGGWEVNRKK